MTWICSTSPVPATAARRSWQRLPRRHLERGLPGRHPGRSRVEKAVHPIFVSRRNFQPCCADDARSIHEGGELGYSLSHAFGAAFDNPDLIVACVIGDGEAETGPLATAWQSNKLLNPITDGAVLPILHLNGYKISNPTVLARIEHEELEQFLRGCGWTPHFVEGDDPEKMHELMAATMEKAIEDIRRIQSNARDNHDNTRPRWPMIVLKSPKGWTGPKVVDGLQIEGTFRAHQVPLLVDSEHPEHVADTSKAG
jgi:xylulose-5-phosphate/fructose-6-phosphate phosphoketolase